MKSLIIFISLFFSNCTLAQIEVFCTYSQCKDLGLVSVKPINTQIYILDAHLVYADKINKGQLKGVTSLESAKLMLPKIERTENYKKMVIGLKESGTGINKVVNDYKLDKLPAFVCHPLIRTTVNEFEFGVIYGGSFQKASALCTKWQRRIRK
ncbi:MAG: hypothetical protein V7749_01115 [Cocleimonas sp.]